MENFIVIAIVALIVIGNVFYLHRAKKRGEGCIGCPYARQCMEAKKKAAVNAQAQPSGGQSANCSGNCSCCSGCKK